MSDTMKRVLFYAPGDIRVEDVPEPQIDESYDVKVKLHWCGICGSDLHEYLAGPIFIPSGTPHPVTGEAAPVIMGHEFSGEVVEVGPGVTNVKPGDRVVVEPLVIDDTCPSCKDGRTNQCVNLGFHGLAGKGGGSKREDAIRLGVKVVSEEEFIKMLGQKKDKREPKKEQLELF